MDFFTVPTLTFGVLSCFFVITHDRRRILHLNATQHPTSAWASQQLREAFPYDCAPKYLVFDRASNLDGEAIDTIESFSIQPRRTSFRSPWQNRVAERFVGSCGREFLDHMIVFNEHHLRRLMKNTPEPADGKERWRELQSRLPAASWVCIIATSPPPQRIVGSALSRHGR